MPDNRLIWDTSLCLTAALLVALLGLGISVRADFVHFDLAMVQMANDLAVAGATDLVLDLTALGGSQGALIVTAGAALGLIALRHWHGALALVVSVAVTQAVVGVIKGAVERARPPADAAHVDAAGYAFPSAHAATSVALYGVLALIAVAHFRGGARTSACAAAAAIIASVGATRIYLGAHYPTDVLAGWMVGAIVALLAWRLAQHVRSLADRTVLSPA